MPTYSPSPDATTAFSVLRIGTHAPATALDHVATEEPLEIRLRYRRREDEIIKTVAVTMRTPGQDTELAAGFLFTEGIVRERADIVNIHAATDGTSVITVDLRDGARIDFHPLERNGVTTSSCGVCGKASLDAIRTATRFPLPPPEPALAPQIIHQLPASLRAAQSAFDQTGGLHAAALFTFGGKPIAVREDIGRHNAVDKLIGSQLLATSHTSRSALPLSDQLTFVSSRASFELVQKILMAGCPVLAAVGAPSSLAVELAREAGATLLGFVRENRFNVYAGATRLRSVSPVAAASAS